MKMTNKQYDKLKWVIAIVLPALSVLVGSLGTAYSWPGTDLAVTTISAVTAFLGSVFMVSSVNYKKDGDE